MTKHEWRTETIDTARVRLDRSLESYEEQGFEIFALLPRGEDGVMVVMRRSR